MQTALNTIKRAGHIIKYDLRSSLFWARSVHRNWGDDLNPWLFKKLTGKRAIYCPHQTSKRFVMAGSILTEAGDYDICWGTGLIREDLKIPLRLAKALAVRGPLSAQKLADSGIYAPKVYGDPGLLASRLVTVPKDKKYKVSVIPHYTDRREGEALAREMGYHVINVDLPIEQFIEEVARSEQVWSSSLHGIICPESMGIPTTWVKFSNRIIGGNFKYDDYFLGTGRDVSQPLDLSLPASDLKSARSLDPFDVSEIIHGLLNVFPYKITAEI